MKYLLFTFLITIMENNALKYHKIKTPDNKFFYTKVVSKNEADQLELRYKKSKIDSTLLSVNSQVAYKIEGGKFLYRQFYQDIGFIFPSLDDYKKAISGKVYWSTNIQLDVENKFIVAFLLNPANANSFLGNINRELSEYDSFEKWKFFLLKNKEVIMIKKRSESLSDGYWFNSISDFKFFYQILSGKF